MIRGIYRTLTLTLRKADRNFPVGVVNTDATTIVDDVVDADDGTFWNEPETTYDRLLPL